MSNNNNSPIIFEQKLLDSIKLKDNNLLKSMLTPELCKAFDSLGTLLHYAALYGNHEIIPDLIELGSDIDSKTKKNLQTPLMLAITRGHVEAVKVLLKKNADINMVNQDDESVLKMVFSLTYFEAEIVKVFMSKIKAESVDKEAYIDKVIEAGCTLYHVAISDSPDIIEHMIAGGMSVNSTGFKGKTALHVAAETDNYELALKVSNCDIKLNLTDDDGLTALQIAISKGHVKIVKLLMEDGADPNVKNPETNLPLLYELYARDEKLKKGTDECVLLLLQYGVIVENPPQEDKTLLDHAIIQGNLKRMQYLICHVAMTTDKDIENTVLTCNVQIHKELNYPLVCGYFNQCRKILKLGIMDTKNLRDILTENDKLLEIHARQRLYVCRMLDIFVSYNFAFEYPYYFYVMATRSSRAIKRSFFEGNAIKGILEFFDGDREKFSEPTRSFVETLNDRELRKIQRPLK